MCAQCCTPAVHTTVPCARNLCVGVFCNTHQHAQYQASTSACSGPAARVCAKRHSSQLCVCMCVNVPMCQDMSIWARRGTGQPSFRRKSRSATPRCRLECVVACCLRRVPPHWPCFGAISVDVATSWPIPGQYQKKSENSKPMLTQSRFKNAQVWVGVWPTVAQVRSNSSESRIRLVWSSSIHSSLISPSLRIQRVTCHFRKYNFRQSWGSVLIYNTCFAKQHVVALVGVC